MTSPSTHRKPILLALAASFLLTVLIIVGSRNLEHYDSALFGYTIASVVAFGAIVFRSDQRRASIGAAAGNSTCSAKSFCRTRRMRPKR
jgi:hypothetical protein